MLRSLFLCVVNAVYRRKYSDFMKLRKQKQHFVKRIFFILNVQGMLHKMVLKKEKRAVYMEGETG